MKKVLALLFIFAALPVMDNDSSGLSAQDSLERLKQGNGRFVEMHMKHPDTTKKHRTELVSGQHPFAVILSCSDSRVPPEFIFDQGLGDIFDVRNAGNVLNKHVIGSIEYAVMHLGVKLIVIMGHQDCGAVAAALSDETESEYIESLKASIMPAVKACKKSGNYTNNDVSKAHVIQDIQELLSEDSALKEYMQKHDVQIIPAFYHMDSGEVEFLR
ncbi:MAG: carbonic anhydrase [Heliobacteriaceae bacterium]|jgi:carbonic anhydrase|nr:carbonic anhydrase [Heliobacteriaceae bacterium]